MEDVGRRLLEQLLEVTWVHLGGCKETGEGVTPSLCSPQEPGATVLRQSHPLPALPLRGLAEPLRRNRGCNAQQGMEGKTKRPSPPPRKTAASETMEAEGPRNDTSKC